MLRSALVLVVGATAALLPAASSCGPNGAGAVAGRWDVTVHTRGGDRPSWFEIVEREGQLSGQFVGVFGSARPIRTVSFDAGRLVFALPPQYENRKTEMRFEGALANDRLTGTTTDDRGGTLTWDARRAPSLKRKHRPRWGTPVPLFNGRDLEGWMPRSQRRANGWTVRDGCLYNARPGNDLLSTRKVTDFKLHAEYRYPKESNSGIYLRGRYELQIADDFGEKADSHGSGGIYGFLKPKVNAIRPAGEWQSCDVTLAGRTVTVVLNGRKVMDRKEIPGITGGALESDEGAPGPIFFQGDHGPVELRNLILTPGVP
jgi:hypothetical protein